MTYRIHVAESIEKKLKRIPKRDKSRIIEKIDALSKNPRPEGFKKLQGSHRPPLYRIRAGKYRVVYTIQQEILVVLVLDVGHRSGVYKNG